MRNEQLTLAVAKAIAADLLPPSATVPNHEPHPWPMLLLSAVGAWLVALPFLGVIAFVAGAALTKGAAPYITGIVILGTTLAILREEDLPLFVEQLALPAIMVGLGMLACGLFNDMVMEYAAALLCVIALATARISRRRVLRVMLGGAGSALAVLSLYTLQRQWSADATAQWSAWMCNLVFLLGLWTIQETQLADRRPARHAVALETIGAGWAIITLTGLALSSGATFLLSGMVDKLDTFGFTRNELAIGERSFQLRIVSCAMAIASAALLARQWPSLSRMWTAGVALILAILAGFFPFLGAALLLTAHAASRGRWRLAGMGTLTIVWIVGSLYYRLDLTLEIKAVLLVAVGALLSAFAWRAVAVSPVLKAASVLQTSWPPKGRWSEIALSLLATLSVVNVGIWRNEQMIEHGIPIYIEMAQVDPRSMVQGNYMALRFATSAEVASAQNTLMLGPSSIIVKRDARGVATVVRSAVKHGALAPDEFTIELSHMGGGWGLVSDAWYFKEGEAERWKDARYGEFRVAPNGKALLVGLRDAQLKAL